MSGIKCLLDTNVVIGLLKEDSKAIALAERYQLEFDCCAVSQITRMELLGFPNSQAQEEQEIQEFLKNCTVILLNPEIEHVAIMLRRNGKFKLPDAIIVATAQVNCLTLLSLDDRLQAALNSEK